MDIKEIQELAKEAAKAAVLVTARYYPMNSKKSVDVFLEAYEYAMQELEKKQTPKIPSDFNPEDYIRKGR